MDLAQTYQPSVSSRQGPVATTSSRAGLISLAQITATGVYFGWLYFGEAPAPLSFADLATTLLPPAVLALLLVTGLFGVSSAHVVLWQRLLSGIGSGITACGLVVAVVLVPLTLFGSVIDYTIS